MSTQRSILVVSDEPCELAAISDVVRASVPHVKIVAADSYQPALTQLANDSFEAVFCSFKAGAEDSVDFLTEVAARNANVSRFVVAPSIDAETQIRCVFGSHIYFQKPLDPNAVRAALELSAVGNSIVPSERLQLLIARIRSLPSKPSIYFEVMRELRSDDADPSIIARLIQKDLGVATKLLQVVNSLFYGRAEAIHDIKEAVLFLGFEVTASIVLSLEAISRFDKIQSLHQLADQVWTHSQALAELSRRIAQSFGASRSVCDQVYLAGLLHDLGKLVLAQTFPAEYTRINNTPVTEDRPLTTIERDVLGISHADAGAYLLAVWGLPLAVIEPVGLHHAPASSLGDKVSAATALHLAEEILESDKALNEIISGYPPELQLFDHAETVTALLPDRRFSLEGQAISAAV